MKNGNELIDLSMDELVAEYNETPNMGFVWCAYLKHRERGEALPDFFKDKIDDFLLKHANREAENFLDYGLKKWGSKFIKKSGGPVEKAVALTVGLINKLEGKSILEASRMIANETGLSTASIRSMYYRRKNDIQKSIDSTPDDISNRFILDVIDTIRKTKKLFNDLNLS